MLIVWGILDLGFDWSQSNKKKKRTEPGELGQFAMCRKTWKQKKGKKEKFDYLIYSCTDRGKA